MGSLRPSLSAPAGQEVQAPQIAAAIDAPQRSGEQSALIASLRSIVGRRHTLTGAAARPYATGYRSGCGPVTAVVRPGSLIEQWRVLQLCVAADQIVITQAANTGLTGGSTPNGAYDRGVVIVNTMRISGIHLIRGGSQVVCIAGATLHQLERRLAPIGRDPHSVIGSSCIGASVIGGICNGSGGALVRRGPAYTEYSLFADVDAKGSIRLHNHLGIELGGDPESVLKSVETGCFSEGDIFDDSKMGSAREYGTQIRNVDSPIPARFNADPRRLFESSGSAGRLMVFAVRLDTFASDEPTATFYIGTNDPSEFTTLRRRMLKYCRILPVSAEYIHRDAFDIAARYGKDMFLTIRHLGTDRLQRLIAAKNWVDALVLKARMLPSNLTDRMMQVASGFFPNHLAARMLTFRDRFEHHLILTTSGDGVDETRSLLSKIFPSESGDMFECTAREAQDALLHRFVVAGAAVRYRTLHPDEVEDIVAIDVALRSNDEDWSAPPPNEIISSVVTAIRYGHFFCHVFHQDFLVRKGEDLDAIKSSILASFELSGAECPAEHNYGHLYHAKPSLADHYRALDPGNRLNPGIGQTSRRRDWR